MKTMETAVSKKKIVIHVSKAIDLSNSRCKIRLNTAIE